MKGLSKRWLNEKMRCTSVLWRCGVSRPLGGGKAGRGNYAERGFGFFLLSALII